MQVFTERNKPFVIHASDTGREMKIYGYPHIIWERTPLIRSSFPYTAYINSPYVTISIPTLSIRPFLHVWCYLNNIERPASLCLHREIALVWEYFRLLGIDNFDSFVRAYIINVRAISEKGSLGDPNDPFDMDAELCWMIESNIRSVLVDGKEWNMIPVKVDAIYKELLKGKLLSIHYDNRTPGSPIPADGIDSEDDVVGNYTHFFSVIGSGEQSYIIENSPTECVATLKSSSRSIAELLVSIREGKVPDRFYKVKTNFVMIISSCNRKMLSPKAVYDYIYPTVPSNIWTERDSKMTLYHIWSLSPLELKEELERQGKVVGDNLNNNRVLLAQIYADQYHVFTHHDQELVRSSLFEEVFSTVDTVDEGMRIVNSRGWEDIHSKLRTVIVYS